MRSNKNPLLEASFSWGDFVEGATGAVAKAHAATPLQPASPKSVSDAVQPSDPLSTAAKIYGGSMITGVTSKIIKDMQIVNSIVNKYPNPLDLKARLLKFNDISARILAARLDENTSMEEYKALLRKYVCKSGPGKYLLHAILGPISTVLNITKAVNSDFVTPDDNIADNI